MKTIGLLGGTGWASTIEYYRRLNLLVHAQLGGHHSAKILLKSIDYHDVMENYGKSHDAVARILKDELIDFAHLKADCLIICCNSLHKYYDKIRQELNLQMPVLHAVELTAQYAAAKGHKKVLFLATKFTMEDGVFAEKLEQAGISVTVPSGPEREEIDDLLDQLMGDQVTDAMKTYFKNLIAKYADHDAIILGCTELPLAITAHNSTLPIINPTVLQCEAAVAFALS